MHDTNEEGEGERVAWVPVDRKDAKVLSEDCASKSTEALDKQKSVSLSTIGAFKQMEAHRPGDACGART